MLDAGAVEAGGEAIGSQVIEREAGEMHREQARLAVRGQEQHQHVLVRIHDPADPRQHGVEIAGTGERHVVDRGRVVDEQDRASARGQPVLDDVARLHDLADEHVLGGEARETNEVQVRLARVTGCQSSQRLLDEVGLLVEDGLGVDARPSPLLLRLLLCRRLALLLAGGGLLLAATIRPLRLGNGWRQQQHSHDTRGNRVAHHILQSIQRRIPFGSYRPSRSSHSREDTTARSGAYIRS